MEKNTMAFIMTLLVVGFGCLLLLFGHFIAVDQGVAEPITFKTIYSMFHVLVVGGMIFAIGFITLWGGDYFD